MEARNSQAAPATPDVAALDDVATATAVVYLRVSSAGQVNRGTDPEGYSIPGQREATRGRAVLLGAEVLEEYVEYGVSGRTTQRPALQKMLADLKQLRPTFVIIYDLSRLARNRLDDAQLMLQIESTGAKLVSVLENIDQTASGRLTHGVLAAVNEFRSAGDAEKVMMGLKRKHAMGGTIGKAPIGYLNIRKRVLGRDIRTVEVDPDRASLVQMAFRCYATGEYTITGIAELLEAVGLRTPMTAKRPPKPLARSAVYKMLKNEYYRGMVSFDGSKTDGQHEPIVDAETFEQVQRVLQAHALSGDKARRHEHYLKGSLFCGECGGRLIFTIVKGNGGRYRYFRCFGRHNRRNGCRAPHSRTDEVEAAVERHYEQFRWLTSHEQDSVRIAVQEYVATKLGAAEKEAERAARRLEALKQEQQHLLQLSFKGLVDDDVLSVEQARIKTERANVAKWSKTTNLGTQEIESALEEALELLSDPATAYRLATPTVRRMLNQALFEKLLIDDGEVAQAVPTGWLSAMDELARPQKASVASHFDDVLENDRDPLEGGRGLNYESMVR